MSARHALLGLLLHKPGYPYELADRLKRRMGPSGTINSGYLYQLIKQLEGEDLIEPAGGTAKHSRGRNIVAIKPDGAEEFERWFDEAPNVAPLSRSPLLLKITLAGPERLTEVLEQIDAYERDCASRIAELSRMRDEVDPDEGPRLRADHVCFRLSLSADIFLLEAELRWATHAHEMVSWLMSRETIWPSASERSDFMSDRARDRKAAREKLFGRIATRHLRSAPEKREQDLDA